MRIIINILKTTFIVLILMCPYPGNAQNHSESLNLINYAEWSGSDLKSLYENCIISLQLSNMDIDPIKTSYGKEINMIFTEVMNRIYLLDLNTSYFLSLLIFKLPDNKIAVHIKINNPKIVSSSSTSHTIINKSLADLCISGIAKDMNQIFQQLEILQGKPVITKNTGVQIKY